MDYLFADGKREVFHISQRSGRSDRTEILSVPRRRLHNQAQTLLLWNQLVRMGVINSAFQQVLQTQDNLL